MSFLTDDPEKQRRQVRRWQKTQEESRARYALKMQQRKPVPIDSASKNAFPQAIHEADYWCRKYIRLRDRFCVTPSRECYGQLEASHLYSISTGIALRFDDRVIFAQCSFHNQSHDRDQRSLRKYVEQLYGPGFYERMKEEHFLYKKFTVKELLGIAQGYKDKVMELQNQE